MNWTEVPEDDGGGRVEQVASESIASVTFSLAHVFCKVESSFTKFLQFIAALSTKPQHQG